MSLCGGPATDPEGDSVTHQHSPRASAKRHADALLTKAEAAERLNVAGAVRRPLRRAAAAPLRARRPVHPDSGVGDRGVRRRQHRSSSLVAIGEAISMTLCRHSTSAEAGIERLRKVPNAGRREQPMNQNYLVDGIT